MTLFTRFILIMLSGCALLLADACEFFHNNPLEITGYSPTQEVISPGSEISIWVCFSTEVEKTLTEQAFSFSENEEELQGRFIWEGNTLRFTPFRKLSEGNIYVLRVDTSAEDLFGNSLSHEFSFRFFIGEDRIRPQITGIVPAYGASLAENERLAPISITFSEPIEPASFHKAITISPQVSGAFEWQNTNGVTAYTICVFTPHEEYQWQKEYTITISTELKDAHNNALAEAYISRFSVGTSDSDLPTISSVESFYKDEHSQVVLSAADQNNGWEAYWSIRITFSKPVAEDSLAGNIQISPQLNYAVIWDPGSRNQVDLIPVNRFTYGETYVLTIGKDILDSHGLRLGTDSAYRFCVTGTLSQPPVIDAVYYIADSNNPAVVTGPLENLQEIAIASGTTPDTTINSYLDLYLTSAANATIPEVSIAEHFSISTNNEDISFTVISFAILSTTPEGTELGINKKRIRVFMQSNAKSDVVGSSLITLSVDKEFYDSTGNKMLTDWKLILRNKLPG